MPYHTNVFINFPFDKEYRPIIHSIVFTTIYLGFTPKICSLKSSNEQRVQQIKHLIQQSKYSIHDLSRNEPSQNNNDPRFNMPFELGLDMGCHAFNSKCSDKIALILSSDPYRYRKVLSDISGQDVANHKNTPLEAMRSVRDWFSENTELDVPGPQAILIHYNLFTADLPLVAHGFSKSDLKKMSYTDYIKFATKWISSNVHRY